MELGLAIKAQLRVNHTLLNYPTDTFLLYSKKEIERCIDDYKTIKATRNTQ